ncbi:MAG: TolC family protein [Tannerellaceae bacterium]|nr:TolC family protein [Tannerellaceae bacterium]
MKQIIVLLTLVFMAIPLHAQHTLTLEQCRELAIQNNKELKITGEKVREAGYQNKEAFTNYFPKVSAMGAYLWNQKDLNLVDFDKLGAAGSLVPDGIKDFFHLDIQNIWVGGVTLVQPIFTGGKIITYNQITRYAKELAETMNDQQLQEVIFQVDVAYWQVVSLASKKKLADAYVELLRKTVSDINAMVEEGIATQADALSVKVKLNEAEVAQTKVDNGLALSKMLLCQLCGLPLEDPIRLMDEQVDELRVSGSGVVVADVNEAFANRDELKALDIATKIYKKKENLVLAEHLPNVALSANYLVTNPSAFNGIKHEFGGMFNVGVVVQVPITDWWGGTFKRNAARAETRIKTLELLAARELIELQVHQSVYQMNESEKKLTASYRNMDSADENLRHASLGFEEGVIPVRNLMEAQTAWMAAHSELIDSQIEVKLSEVYLDKSLDRLSADEAK